MLFNLKFPLIIGVFFVISCATTHNMTHEMVGYNDIKEIISTHCLSCHGNSSPPLEEFKKDKENYKGIGKGPKMDSYDELIKFVKGSDAGALMRRLDDGKNTKDGKPGNMYQYLGNTDSERSANLEILKRWIGHWTLKKKAEMTDDDIKAIKALKE